MKQFNNSVNEIFNSFTTPIQKKIIPVYEPKKINDIDALKFKNYINNQQKTKEKEKIPNIFFKEREKFINITSNSNQFIRDISKNNLTNVISIELVGTKFNNINNGNDVFIKSRLLGGDFSISGLSENNIFAQIQLKGSDSNDVLLNSYIGGKKIFHRDTVKKTINLLDISIIDVNGLFVEIPQNVTYSIVLKATELIKKVENSEYNTNIGFSFNNARGTETHTHIFESNY